MTKDKTQHGAVPPAWLCLSCLWIRERCRHVRAAS